MWGCFRCWKSRIRRLEEGPWGGSFTRTEALLAPQDGAGLRFGGGQLILDISGLVLREGHVLLLEEEPGGDGL